MEIAENQTRGGRRSRRRLKVLVKWFWLVRESRESKEQNRRYERDDGTCNKGWEMKREKMYWKQNE